MSDMTDTAVAPTSVDTPTHGVDAVRRRRPTRSAACSSRRVATTSACASRCSRAAARVSSTSSTSTSACSTATPRVDFGGVEVVVDKMSVPYLDGASIDFEDTIQKQGFTIDNPNAAGSLRLRRLASTDFALFPSGTQGVRRKVGAFPGYRLGSESRRVSREVTGALQPPAGSGPTFSRIAGSMGGAPDRPRRRDRARRLHAGSSSQGYLPAEPETTNQTEPRHRPLGHLVDRAPRRRRRHLGPHHLGRGRLPPPQGPDRPAGAAALQPADRDLLHDRSAHPHHRLLRLHRARPGRRSSATRATRTSQIEVFGKRWSWDFNYVNENVYSPGIQAQERLNGDGTIDEDRLPVLYLPVDAEGRRSTSSRATSPTPSGSSTSSTRRT